MLQQKHFKTVNLIIWCPCYITSGNVSHKFQENSNFRSCYLNQSCECLNWRTFCNYLHRHFVPSLVDISLETRTVPENQGVCVNDMSMKTNIALKIGPHILCASRVVSDKCHSFLHSFIHSVGGSGSHFFRVHDNSKTLDDIRF